ncbi:p24 complex component [Saitoella coloradoensis]
MLSQLWSPLLLLLAAALAIAHTVNVRPHVRECFHESLHRGDTMTVSFQVGVGDGGNGDIDFWLTDPKDSVLISDLKSSTGDHSFEAQHDGTYRYCFSNEMSSISTKEVSFNVHGIVYVPENQNDPDHSDPVEKEIRELADLLNAVKDEQEYIVVRERRHRNTAESTNTRVKWWSVTQGIVLVCVGVFQVFYLKRFFEVKRVL